MRHHIKTAYYLLLFATLFFTSCKGQNNSSRLNLSEQDSTSKQIDSSKNKINYIRCAAIQDMAGNLWFGTSGNGLFRYDGKSSTHFTMNDGLQANNVQALYEDSKGRIWISSGQKVCYYNGSSFIHVPIIAPDINFPGDFPNNTSASQNKTISIFGICEDKNGNIWFTALDDGVYCYDGKKVTHFEIGRLIQSATKDNEGNLWFNFTRYNDSAAKNGGKTFTTISPWGNTSALLVLNSIKAKNGNLWFSVRRSGLYHYDARPAISGAKSFTHYSMKDGLCNDYSTLSFLFEDKSGKLWVGDNGNGMGNNDICLCWFDGKVFHQVTNLVNRKELMNNYARPVVGDRDGNIWISAGNSLFRYDTHSTTGGGNTLTDFTAKVFNR